MVNKDRDSDTSASAGQTAHGSQSKRPGLQHHVSHDSDSQISDQASQLYAPQRPKKHHLVGGGSRLHAARVPSSKGLHKNHHQLAPAAKLTHPSSSLTQQNRRHASPSPERTERPERPERPPMLPATHRRTTSDVRLARIDSPASFNLKKSASHTSIKRNRSHVDVGKRAKSGANIKRSSSTKDVNKLKGPKGQVHFDLGNDGQDEENEWVDASGSASPYLSRRGSVVGSGQSLAKPPASPEHTSKSPRRQHEATSEEEQCGRPSTPDRERLQHKEYLTSRLLQRTPSHGAPPKMSSETARVQPHTNSPDSNLSRDSSVTYGSTPKMGSAADELTSRFVSGPSSGVNADTGSYFSLTKASSARQGDLTKRPRSMVNLQKEPRQPAADENEVDDDSALAPRSRRSGYRAPPAEKSRTQQKLNLQRASSSMEPVQAGKGVSVISASPLVGSNAYDNRDPRISRLLERTGMEYLVVRRYQNPIARSITRLRQLPGADKTQHIPKQNGAYGTMHSKKPSSVAGLGSARHSFVDTNGTASRSRPDTPRRTQSIRTIRANGANTSFEAEDETAPEGLSGTSYADDDNEGITTLLRNLWEKNLDLSASQD
ncbi:uncharacterized protein PG986_001370 [Apiospora aurea]|uniref:Uncharacterized protein n=1 Tax=Apiospora aurea TaxID=335848 RepID=A0ABR1QWR0_9PEZI